MEYCSAAAAAGCMHSTNTSAATSTAYMDRNHLFRNTVFIISTSVLFREYSTPTGITTAVIEIIPYAMGPFNAVEMHLLIFFERGKC